MFLFDFFRSFLPLHNPIGFGAADFVEMALAALLVALVLAHARLEGVARKFAERTGWCMLLLAVLPVALRLALLAQSPVPTPGGSDDFSYLLLGDTLRHFRLANPTHPLHQFFEANFVLQEPSYSSIFPAGQGIALALGWILFGHPWAGVMLSMAALCSLCYWMLRGWTTPGWALAGGLLAVCEFGPLNYWMNSYWGGAVSGIAGCLVFGALGRLGSGAGRREAALLGLGFALQWLTRPFECVVLAVCAVAFFLPRWRVLVKVAPVAALAFLPGAALTLLQNHAVTGSWTTLPYELSRYQYGVPTTFTFQPNPVPHRQLTSEQQLGYEAQAAVHGDGHDSVGRFLGRLGIRAGFYRFFFYVPLYLVLPAFLLSLREFRFAWVLGTVVLVALADNFYPYFYPHYIAALTCVFVLISVTALERLGSLHVRGIEIGQDAARLVIFLCAAHFLLWYGLHSTSQPQIARATAEYEVWDYINSGDPGGRVAINRRLDEASGKQLVFVRYFPQHMFHEWIYNAADIDGARVVRAIDLGPDENEKLLRYFPDRTVWLLEPDAIPPRLRPYPR